MNKEEICLRLIEFYYENKSILNNYGMGLIGFFEKYNKMLEVLKVKSDE